MDSNRGPLVSEVTALPTEPQPLPIYCYLLVLIYLGRPDDYYFTNEKRLNSIYDIKCVIPCRPNLIFLFKSI